MSLLDKEATMKPVFLEAAMNCQVHSGGYKSNLSLATVNISGLVRNISLWLLRCARHL